jgi:hypothetical protein
MRNPLWRQFLYESLLIKIVLYVSFSVGHNLLLLKLYDVATGACGVKISVSSLKIVNILLLCAILTSIINLSGYWKNRPSQKLFKVFIYTYILPLHVSALSGHPLAVDNIFWKLLLLYIIYNVVTTHSTERSYFIKDC